MPVGPYLAPCIRLGLSRLDSDRLIKTLEELTHDRRRFISIDGITSRLADAGCPRHMLKRIHDRLQVLHWESRAEGHIELPLLSRAMANKLDSSDPEVFWAAVDGLLGRDLQRTLMALPWQTALSIAHQLRDDPVWTSFVETYHVIVDTVDRDHPEIVEALVTSEVTATYPTMFGILRRTKPDKWTVLSWVCHAGSWLVGVPAGWSLVFKVGSGVAAVKKAIGYAGKVKNALFASERHLIVSRVRRMIEDATKTK